MNITEGRVNQLRCERDAFKRQMDEVYGQREHLRAQQQRLLSGANYVEAVLQSALGRGDLDGVRNAKARLAEIRQQRDDCFDTIAALSNRHGVLQSQYGEAFTQWQHAENDAEFLARRIPDLRRRLATARWREGEYDRYNDGNSPALLSAELQKCEIRYYALTGQSFAEQSPAAAA
jgi:chromosome segregation ATPase